VRKEKRERLLFLAAKAGRWSDFCEALLHDTRSLEPSVMKPLDAREADVEGVLQRLGAKAPTSAYAVSAIAEIDDRELPLGDALRAAIGRERDTLVLCIATGLAFYENHEGEQLVLGGSGRRRWATLA